MTQRHFVLTAAQMRALDARTIGALGLPGIVLMERAALGVLAQIEACCHEPGRALVLAGPGNNGGDGWAVARLLVLRGWDVAVVSTHPTERLGDDARTMHDAARRAGVRVVDVEGAATETAGCDVIVDAVLGIGLSDAPHGSVSELLAVVATELDGRPRRPLVVAVDVPSGVVTDTGVAFDTAIRADVTVACGERKWAHVLPPAIDLCGEVVVADIGIPPSWRGEVDAARLYGAADARHDHAPARWRDHKGSRGRVLVVAGSETMPGAATLAASAALRAGAGLVGVAGPAAVRSLALQHAPELIGVDPTGLGHGIPHEWDAVVLGPGIGVDERGAALLRAALASIGERPIVLDADALTLLAGRTPAALPPGTIMTPHPGELARLLDLSTAEVTADLPAAARLAHSRWGAVVVAKTAGAIIVGRDVCFVEGGHPGMASAGMGDVLAGIVGGLAARCAPETAAALGAWLHARAGRAAGITHGAEPLTASATIEALGDAFRALAGSGA